MSDAKQNFSVNRAEGATFQDGLRSFLEYRDLGTADATNGLVRAHVIRVKQGNTGDQDMHTTGLHQHMVDFQFFYVLKGWIKFVYEGQEGEFTFRAGDCVVQPKGIVHNELACSDDVELLEVLSPAVHDTRAVEAMPDHTGDGAQA